MMSNLTTLSPRQTFEDNMRPAQLLLRVYRLLDANDVILTDGDIVHRADRSQSDLGGDAQDISFSWTQHSMDTINHICLALDELVVERIRTYSTLLSA
jgi:hypothetical protein